MLALRRKKMYEEECNRQHHMLANLDKQKFTLEAAEETSVVFETLSLATATTSEYLSQHSSEQHNSFAEEIRNEMAQQEENRAGLDNLFAQGAGTIDEDELLRELENLSLCEESGQHQKVLDEIQRQEGERLDQQLQDYERRLQQLR